MNAPAGGHIGDHTGDLRARVVALENQAIVRDAKITNTELWQRAADIDDARKSEMFKAMDKRFDNMEKDITEIKSSLTWVVRLILGGLVGGLFTVVIRLVGAA